MSDAVTVNVDNFVRAETDLGFQRLVDQVGGVNRWDLHREPMPLDKQLIPRLNRDTLYSAAIVDVREGAVLTLPDAGDRYQSAMILSQDHDIAGIFHAPGEHEISADSVGTPYALVGIRMLVDPANPDDVAEVNRLQDGLRLEAGSDTPFEHPEYDEVTLSATRGPLLELARGLPDFRRTFGARGTVDPVRRLLGVAAGYGGLPESEAVYENVDLGLPVGEYHLRVDEVPVDAFWSVTVYNAAGYLEPNDRGINSINSITAQRDDDGAVTVRFGQGEAANTIPISDGWNYTVRMYRPRAEISSGNWRFPRPEQG